MGDSLHIYHRSSATTLESSLWQSHLTAPNPSEPIRQFLRLHGHDWLVRYVRPGGEIPCLIDYGANTICMAENSSLSPWRLKLSSPSRGHLMIGKPSIESPQHHHVPVRSREAGRGHSLIRASQACSAARCGCGAFSGANRAALGAGGTSLEDPLVVRPRTEQNARPSLISARSQKPGTGDLFSGRELRQGCLES